MNKKNIKLIVSIICILLFFVILPSVVKADVASQAGALQGSTINADGIKTVFSKVLGAIQVVGGLLSVIVIAYAGFKMVTEDANGKAKVKEALLPIVVGILLMFMAATIAKFIIGVFENSSSGSSGGSSTTWEPGGMAVPSK